MGKIIGGVILVIVMIAFAVLNPLIALIIVLGAVFLKLRQESEKNEDCQEIFYY